MPVENPEGRDRTGWDVVEEGFQTLIPDDDEETIAEWIEDETRRAAGDAA